MPKISLSAGLWQACDRLVTSLCEACFGTVCIIYYEVISRGGCACIITFPIVTSHNCIPVIQTVLESTSSGVEKGRRFMTFHDACATSSEWYHSNIILGPYDVC